MRASRLPNLADFQSAFKPFPPALTEASSFAGVYIFEIFLFLKTEPVARFLIGSVYGRVRGRGARRVTVHLKNHRKSIFLPELWTIVHNSVFKK